MQRDIAYTENLDIRNIGHRTFCNTFFCIFSPVLLTRARYMDTHRILHANLNLYPPYGSNILNKQFASNHVTYVRKFKLQLILQ
jgi:hypothetical protein